MFMLSWNPPLSLDEDIFRVIATKSAFGVRPSPRHDFHSLSRSEPTFGAHLNYPQPGHHYCHGSLEAIEVRQHHKLAAATACSSTIARWFPIVDD